MGGFYVAWSSLLLWVVFLLAAGVVVFLVGSTIVYGYSQRMMWYRVWTHERYRVLHNLDVYRSEDDIQQRVARLHRGFDTAGGDAVRKGTIWYPMYLLGWWIAGPRISGMERMRKAEEAQEQAQEEGQHGIA